MTMSTKYPKVRNRKVLLAAVVAIAVVLSGTIVAYQAISSASAVQSTNMTALPGNKPVPMINGSINVIQTTKNIIKDNLKVSFSQAAGIAEKQVTNGTVIGGHLGIVQGYLVYKFYAVNQSSHTIYITLVDAGNGKVLYTSQGITLANGIPGPVFPRMFGPLGQVGPHGSGDRFEQGQFGFGHWRGSEFNASGGIWH
ncbi:MAG: PepSY domain-containing protein [Nitrososphaeraceae archaeon]